MSETSETIEIVGVDADRGFMTTPFEDYTVTEGFLLLLFILAMLTFVLNLFRR